ncbi:DUF7547 family protein [Haloarcula marina]|uniref:DUF7547 family protein n=1 Tax=Haloarcula marina TaxID=2961574 RepID=UPI0020B6C0E3|nr:hypothetical protein [Halomicroarcula marina]
MTTSTGDDIPALLTDLVRTLQELETEVEPRTDDGRPRPPTLDELLRFTSDVTIPAAILVLQTNVEALKLLRRALRMAEGRPTSTGSGSDEMRRRATELSKATLTRLDDALTELQTAVEGRPSDREAAELLDEARTLRADLEAKLEESTREDGQPDEESTTVPVDVDAELESIKDDLGADTGQEGTDDPDGGPDNESE